MTEPGSVDGSAGLPAPGPSYEGNQPVNRRQPGHAATPRLVQAQKTKNKITDTQGNALRIALHPELRRAAPPVPEGWVANVSAHELASRLVSSAVFLVSLRKGTRRVLNLPAEWALLWAVPADQPVGVWLLEAEGLSIEEERQIVRATLLRQTYWMPKRAVVEFAARCGFFDMSKTKFAKVLSTCGSDVHYHLNPSRTVGAKGGVPEGSSPSPPQARRSTKGISPTEAPEPRSEEPPPGAALGPRLNGVPETVDRDSSGPVESQKPGPPGHAAAHGTRRQEEGTSSQLSWLGEW